MEEFFDGRQITIWEMRNPFVMKQLTKLVFDFNFNQDAIDKISQFKPINRDKLGLDMGMDDFAPQVRERLTTILDKLEGKAKTEGTTFIVDICKALLNDVLFEGSEAFHRSLLAKQRAGPVVLSHCDPNETNVLASKRDFEQMMLIDYEFADWNPLATDIAIIFNELTCDNAAPHSNFNSGVRYYESNFPTRSEMECVASEYLRHYFFQVEDKDGSTAQFQSWLESRLPSFMEEIQHCCILVNFNWICAVIMMMKEDEECDASIFNWEYCR